MGYVTMLVSRRVITISLKKHQKLKCALGDRNFFGSSYRKAAQMHVFFVNFPGVWRAELENGWGDPSS